MAQEPIPVTKRPDLRGDDNPTYNEPGIPGGGMGDPLGYYRTTARGLAGLIAGNARGPIGAGAGYMNPGDAGGWTQGPNTLNPGGPPLWSNPANPGDLRAGNPTAGPGEPGYFPGGPMDPTAADNMGRIDMGPAPSGFTGAGTPLGRRSGASKAMNAQRAAAAPPRPAASFDAMLGGFTGGPSGLGPASTGLGESQRPGRGGYEAPTAASNEASRQRQLNSPGQSLGNYVAPDFGPASTGLGESQRPGPAWSGPQAGTAVAGGGGLAGLLRPRKAQRAAAAAPGAML